MPKPTLMVYNKTIVCQTMDDEHCIIAVISSEVAKFKRAADKTPLQRLFYVRRFLRGLRSRPLAHRSREGLRRFGNDAAKIRTFRDMTKNNVIIQSFGSF